MANIRINSLPSEASPSASDVVPIDGAATRKTTLTALVNAGRPLATQAEAEAGTDANKAMTPLTTAQAVAALGAAQFASTAQGATADSALQPAAIGVSVQAYSEMLAGMADLPVVSGDILYGSGSNEISRLPMGTDGQVLRLNGGLPEWTTATGLGDLLAANNLSDVASAPTALTNLGFSTFWSSLVGATTYAAAWLLLKVNGSLPSRTLLKSVAPSVGMTVLLSEAGREGQFVWRDDDYSAQIAADTLEGIYVKADGIAATAGAWVRQGGWLVEGLDVRWFGVVTNDDTFAEDNSDGIQAAIDFAAVLFPGLPVKLPAGTIELALNQTRVILGSASPCALRLRDKTVMRGAGKFSTTLKIRDNESTDAAPLRWNAMIGNEIFTDIEMSDFTWDLNGQNNKVNPDRSRFIACTLFNGTPGQVGTNGAVPHGLSINDPVQFWRSTAGQTLMTPIAENTTYYVKTVPGSTIITVSATPGGAAINMTLPGSGTVMMERVGTWIGVNCAALIISGTVSTTGDARITNGTFRSIHVKNGPGYSSFAIGHGVTVAGSPVSEHIEFDSCSFYNNGIDVDDHSSIFAYANWVNVHNCWFDHPTPSTSFFGPAVAMEIHGSHQTFANNFVRNYNQALWICGDIDELVKDIKVTDNTVICNGSAFATWTISPLDEGLESVILRGNNITLTADALYSDGSGAFPVRYAFNIQNTVNFIRRLLIEGNISVCEGTRANGGILIGGGDATSFMSDIDIVGNQFHGFASNVMCSGQRPVYNCNIRGNDFAAITPSLQYIASDTRGITIFGANGSWSIQDNAFSASSGNLQYGILVAGTATFDGLRMEGNRFLNAAVEISDAGTVTSVGRRRGIQALHKFTSAPAEGTWDVGDFVPVRPGSMTLSGTAPNRTIAVGWTRMVAGTAVGASTVGTHWALKIEQLGV